jgi:hypothetical protein
VTCTTCQERRKAIMDAWLEGKIAEAVRETAKGVRDIVKGVGKKEKEDGKE